MKDRIEMNYDRYTSAVQELLNEINGSMGLDLELHPAWSYPILDARTVSFGYKLHRRTGETRTMSLAVHAVSGFAQSADGSMTLTSTAKQQTVSAIADFWSDGNSERHRFVDTY
jgi:hypothetical protein